jgi:hypothetical protein
MVNSTFSMKNFRIFDEKGATFEIAPITILTGCNSSGKSSIIKAIMLLHDYFQQIMEDFNKGRVKSLEKYNLNFISEAHNLGLFENIVNKFSQSKEVSFSFSKFSCFVNGDIDVELTFENNKESLSKNGTLKSIVCKYENSIFFSIQHVDNEWETKYDFLVVKEKFFDFTTEAKEFFRWAELITKYQYSNISKTTTDSPDIEMLENKPEKDPLFDMNERWKKKDLFLQEQGVFKEKFKNFESFVKSDLAIVNRSNNNVLLKHTVERNSLFSTPFYKLIVNLNKYSIEEEVSNLINSISNLQKWNKEKLYDIISDFMKSDFTFFGEYYDYYQDLFLQNIRDEKKHNNNYFETFFKGVYNEAELIDFRSRLLYVDDGWGVGTGENNEPVWVKNGPSDFGNPKRKFKVIFKLMQDIGILVDGQYRIDNQVEQLYGSADIRVKDFEFFLLYYAFLLHDCFVNIPSFLKEPHFISAERVNLQRFYTKDSNPEFSKLLFKLVKAIDEYESIKNDTKYESYESYESYAFTKKWLGKDKFNIAEDILIETISDGFGIRVLLKKNGKFGLLADEGFGISKLISIILNIELLIILNYIRCFPVPSEFEHMMFRGVFPTIIIEEPESNLHPNFQAMIADLLVDASDFIRKNAFDSFNGGLGLSGFAFIVETHSEYLIRQTQIIVKDNKFASKSNYNPIVAYYIDKNNNTHWKMEYREDGKFANNFGTGFLDAANKQIFELL